MKLFYSLLPVAKQKNQFYKNQVIRVPVFEKFADFHLVYFHYLKVLQILLTVRYLN